MFGVALIGTVAFPENIPIWDDIQKFSGYHLLRATDSTFLATHVDNPRAEFYLSTAIGDAVLRQRVRVRVHASDDRLLGLTHQNDVMSATRVMRNLIDTSTYSESLYSTQVVR
jgi:hypothetical protein